MHNRLLHFDHGHAGQAFRTTPAMSTPTGLTMAEASTRPSTTRTSYPCRQPRSNTDKRWRD